MVGTRTPLKEINRIRKELNLKPIIRKIVPCFVCKKNFESKDYPRERMCFKCRSNEECSSAFSLDD
jgi:uncharacterized CHY-type Zn-finger protein